MTCGRTPKYEKPVISARILSVQVRGNSENFKENRLLWMQCNGNLSHVFFNVKKHIEWFVDAQNDFFVKAIFALDYSTSMNHFNFCYEMVPVTRIEFQI